jgi:5-formyltetrahydrofolate cyclo-ligase
MAETLAWPSMDPLDPGELGELVELAKKQLRQRMRALRAAHPATTLAERSGKVVAAVAALEAFRDARSVALFHPLLARNEVDIRPLDALARAGQKRVYYPGIREDQSGRRHTDFRLTHGLDDLAERGQRFCEPPLELPSAARGDVELVVVPALAVALSGHRLGWGGGFYDTALPDLRPPARAVVVAFDFQLLAEVPHLAHDVACDLVVTDAHSVSAENPG